MNQHIEIHEMSLEEFISILYKEKTERNKNVIKKAILRYYLRINIRNHTNSYSKDPQEIKILFLTNCNPAELKTQRGITKEILLDIQKLFFKLGIEKCELFENFEKPHKVSTS